jgi:aminocarboxymuconate-semialdehyde decarboxylase
MATKRKSKAPRERKAPAKGGKRPFVIDVHTHIRAPRLLDFIRQNPLPKSSSAVEDWFSAGSTGNLASLDRDKTRWARLTDAKTRLRAMNRQGIDIQVLSANFPVTCYCMSPAKGLKAAVISNDEVAEFVDQAPDRFVGLAVVPLQDAKRSAGELERSVKELGLRGAWIASNILGMELGDRRLWPFWAKAEELGVPIFVHPLGTTDVSRLKKFHLFNTIGQPLEEAMAMASLILEGVMDAYPRLKVVICHGGGYLPFYSGRSDHAYRTHKIVRENAKQPPSTYLRRFYYDTIVFDHDMLSVLIKKAGLGQVMLGSDYPLVMEDAVAFLKGARQLGREAKERIYWKNAAKLMKIAV